MGPKRHRPAADQSIDTSQTQQNAVSTTTSSSIPVDDPHAKLRKDIQDVLDAHQQTLEAKRNDQTAALKRATEENDNMATKIRKLDMDCERLRWKNEGLESMMKELETDKKQLELEKKCLADCIVAVREAVNATDVKATIVKATDVKATDAKQTRVVPHFREPPQLDEHDELDDMSPTPSPTDRVNVIRRVFYNMENR